MCILEKSQDNLRELVLSFHDVGPNDRSQVCYCLFLDRSGTYQVG